MELLDLLLKDGVKDILRDGLKDLLKEAIREMNLEDQASIQTGSDTTSLVDRKEAARILNISLPTLDLYSKQGIIMARRIGKKILFSKNDLLNAGKVVTLNKYKRKQDL